MSADDPDTTAWKAFAAAHTADEIFDADIPASAPAAVVPGTREALEYAIASAKALIACDDSVTYPSRMASGYVRKNIRELIETVERFLSAPAPPADGAREGTRLPDTYDDGFTAGRKFERDRQITITLDRDWLGRMVRHAWIEWAKTQEAPKPSWLLAYEELSESDREADRQIGEYLIEWAKKYVPSALLPSGTGTAEPVAWECTDDRYPYVRGIVTTRAETVEAWREGGIRFTPLMRDILPAQFSEPERALKKISDLPMNSSFISEVRRIVREALSSAPEATVSACAPETIVAGIAHFGLAADGSDLRDLLAAIVRLRTSPQDVGREK